MPAGLTFGLHPKGAGMSDSQIAEYVGVSVTTCCVNSWAYFQGAGTAGRSCDFLRPALLPFGTHAE